MGEDTTGGLGMGEVLGGTTHGSSLWTSTNEDELSSFRHVATGLGAHVAIPWLLARSSRLLYSAWQRCCRRREGRVMSVIYAEVSDEFKKLRVRKRAQDHLILTQQLTEVLDCDSKLSNV